MLNSDRFVKNKFMQLSKPVSFLIICIVLLSCKDNRTIEPWQQLQGGKGEYIISIFTRHNGVGKDSRIFLKYAANTNPGDTTLFDDRSNTMVEPEFEPHSHFGSLTIGTYYFYCMAKGNLTADTVLVIEKLSPKSFDVNLSLK